jgi:hypothetical protein
MQSFNEKVLDIFHRRRAVEIGFLVRTVLKPVPIKRTEAALMEGILRAALKGQTGLALQNLGL